MATLALIPISVPCSICEQGLLTASMSKDRKTRIKKGKSTICSSECRRILSSRTMSKTNIKYASDRMKEHNPMTNKDSLEKMKTTLKVIGHKPITRGGNGTGPSLAEKVLSDALGFPTNVIVRTLKKRGEGYPYHYKLDLGHVEEKLAIEIDGNSHKLLSRKEQDLKKERFLKSLGWTILRFTNKDVLEDLDACCQLVTETMMELKCSLDHIKRQP